MAALDKDDPRDSTQNGGGHEQITLPPEVMTYIFGLVVKDCGPVPSLCKLGQICRYWRSIATDPCFWKDVDLSSGWINKTAKGLHILCSNFMGNFTKSLNLEAWFTLHDSDIMMLQQSCVYLKSINLSSCESLAENSLPVLADQFPFLESLDFALVSPLAVGTKPLTYFVEKKGPQLKRLNLSGNYLSKDFSKTLNLICERCHVLEELVLSNVETPGVKLQVNVAMLQRGCPLLRHLSLYHTPAFSIMFNDRGVFPSLESFIVPSSTASHQVLIRNVLATAPCMKELDLAEEANDYLMSVNSPVLESVKFHLYDVDALFCLRKWKDTLQVVDLMAIDLTSTAAVSRFFVDTALENLFKNTTFKQLHTLYLCGTLVSWNGLSAVVRHCRTLRLLNCVRCQNIPRFWARELRGELLQQLYRQINDGMEIEDLRSLTVNETGS